MFWCKQRTVFLGLMLLFLVPFCGFVVVVQIRLTVLMCQSKSLFEWLAEEPIRSDAPISAHPRFFFRALESWSNRREEEEGHHFT